MDRQRAIPAKPQPDAPPVPPTPPPLPNLPKPSSPSPPNSVPPRPPEALQPALPSITLAGTGVAPAHLPPDQSSSAVQVVAVEEPPEKHEDEAHRLARAAPPWLASLLTHALLLTTLGLLFLPQRERNTLELDGIFADSVGEQLDEFVAMSGQSDPSDEQAIVFDHEWVPVDDPLLAPPKIEIVPDPLDTAATFSAPTIGVALKGREAGMKAALLKAYGGTAETEAAVDRGLDWLRRRQEKRGSWSLIGPYSQGGSTENRSAATAMALLAFQGAGHTRTQGSYQAEVTKAWYYLLDQQDELGCFYQSTAATNHRFYTHALATIAICELYGMSGEEDLREPAERAIQYLVKTQDGRGGWRYLPKSGSDLSVTGWVVMSLQSARMAKLDVPEEVFKGVSAFLDDVSSGYGEQYGYMTGYSPTESMTAEGLLCRQYLGWQRNDPRLISGVEYLLQNPIKWRVPNLYYWYYATQVMHHMEGKPWEEWNNVLREEIPKRQEQVGPEKGSWYQDRDRWTDYGGRLYSTCLCLYMLEVYYRHLPIYSHVYR